MIIHTMFVFLELGSLCNVCCLGFPGGVIIALVFQKKELKN